MSPRLQPYVIQVPLFHALDGTDTADYVQRVEPSAQVRVRVRVTVTLTLTLTLTPTLTPTLPLPLTGRAQDGGGHRGRGACLWSSAA